VRFTGKEQDYGDGRPDWRPIPAWSWMITAVLAVGLTALIITAWLLAIASHANQGTDLANADLDAVRTGLGAGAGAGVAVGLMLAFRRQHHQEISTALIDHDATQRRITELYTKAVEQLGSDKGPVRLGGLYALERLAQDNWHQRQTIVNVICAYLRMPFESGLLGGIKIGSSGSENTAGQEADINTIPGGTNDASWQQEKQVRLAAQRILSEHLCRPDMYQSVGGNSHARYWTNIIRLDLSGATLFDFNLSNGTVAEALFTGTTFNGYANFYNATFSGRSSFDMATFNDRSEFSRATFTETAGFYEVTFGKSASFPGAIFSGDINFSMSTFSATAWFDDAIFARADFRGVNFRNTASFKRSTFGDGADFKSAVFSGTARFDEVAFSDFAEFEEAIFNRHAEFGGAAFSGIVVFYNADFKATAIFDEATFSNSAEFSRAGFGGTVGFYNSTFGDGAAFGDATFCSFTRFDKATFVNPGALDFTNAMTLSPEHNKWPSGWQTIGSGEPWFQITRCS
jgi:uncharacterized protein YjbI with pentapeptide repeats